MPTTESVPSIGTSIKLRISELDEIESQTTERSFHERVSATRRRFLEVDKDILARIKSEPMRPEDVRLWLVYVNLELGIAERDTKMLSRAVRDYGPGVMFI